MPDWLCMAQPGKVNKGETSLGYKDPISDSKHLNESLTDTCPSAAEKT